MFQFLVNAEGGLTAAGYVLCIAAGIILFAAALIFAGRISEKKKWGPDSWYSAPWPWLWPLSHLT